MTFIAYTPEPPMYQDTILAFKAFEEAGKRVGCTIDPDPFGPVNRIVSLVVGRDQRRVKAALVPWWDLVGAEVKVEREHGSFSLHNLFAFHDLVWDARGEGRPEPRMEIVRLPGYRVTVDGREVLYASDSEIWPQPKPIPDGALKSAQKRVQRLQGAIRARSRASSDRLARRLGYHRDNECGGLDE